MFRVFFILVLLFTGFKANATDIDTFAGLKWAVPEKGQEIRLLAIYPYDLPLALEENGYRYLVPEEHNITHHWALLAHIMDMDGTWLQESLVSEGKAIVMPVYETNAQRLVYLKDVEAGARENRLGFWGNNPGFLHCANDARQAFDSFALVQGRLVDAARVRNTVYLNFGEDWRTDFTIKITNRTFRKLPEEMQNTLDLLIESDKPDTVIEARGWVYFEGGPMINIQEAAQLDFLEPASSFIKEGCMK